MRHLVLLCTLLVMPALNGAWALAPFHAAAVPVNGIDVKLYPTEHVSLEAPTLVTFGLPFPRGSITAAQLDTVRVLVGGVEIPVFVEQITPWRHRTNSNVDGLSVRVARIQFEHTFSTPMPGFETVKVSWGAAPRSLPSPAYQNPRNAWHEVDSGTFLDVDNVYEPDVYAVLPKGWLTRGTLKSVQSSPFDDASGVSRDIPISDPSIVHWPGWQEAERAMKNNFYSVVNQDDPAVTPANQCQYRTQYEPWLYDRASTMFLTYFRSGGFSALREAVRAASFFANHVDAGGFFDLRPGDAKYAYNESLAYALWTTGDPGFLPALTRVPNAHAGTPHEWTPTRNFWTERHVAFKLLANVVAYEVLGSVSYRDTINDMVADLVYQQNGSGGLIPVPAGMDGALYHYGFQHDYDWDENTLGASSWMSVLVVDAMLRAYSSGEDAATAQFIQRMGNFLRVATVSTDEHSYDTFGGPLALPRYGVHIDGSDGQRNYEDVEHALDVAAGLAWAVYFAEFNGAPDPSLAQTAQSLYFTYDTGVNFWTRPGGPAAGLPAYRVSPWRKWGWEHRVSDGLGFALAAGVDEIFNNGFE